MRAMILAAGLGTRLRPLTDGVPKAVVPVGLESALGRWLRVLSGHGFCDVVVNLHHLGAVIRREVEAHPVPGLRVHWSEEAEILGTGGGIRRALAHLGGEPFLVVNADVVMEPDLTGLLEAHERSGALATMVLRRDGDAVRKGAVEVDRARIVRRLLGAPSKAPGPLEVLAFAGVQVLDPRVAPFLPEVGCIVRTLYRGLVDEDGGRLGAFVDDGPWTDIGSPEGYLRANLEVAGEGVLADVSAVVEAGARVGPSVVLGPGARVLAGAVVRRAVVWPDTVVGGDLEEAVATPFATLTCRATAPRSR